MELKDAGTQFRQQTPSVTENCEDIEKFETDHFKLASSFKCKKCSYKCKSMKVLNHHIFREHKDRILCKFYLAGKGNRSECGYSHCTESYKNRQICRNGETCAFMLKSKCWFWHPIRALKMVN